MAYQGTHYNYQVIVIFAILLGGVLLLALVIGAIYFVCVNNMRDDDRKRIRSRPSSAQAWGPGGNVAPQQTAFQPSNYPPYSQAEQYGARPISASPAVQQYNVSQSPLVAQMPQDMMYTNQYRQLQPEVVYTQGPTSYVAQTPIDYTMNREPFRTSAI